VGPVTVPGGDGDHLDALDPACRLDDGRRSDPGGAEDTDA